MEFSDSEYMSSAEKTKIYNRWVRFSEEGFKESDFTKNLYRYLSNSFGFIAHYNQSGFFDALFFEPKDRRITLDLIVSYPYSTKTNVTPSRKSW